MISPSAHIPDYSRLKVFSGLILLIFGVIIARLWFLQIVKAEEFVEQSETLRKRLIRRVGARGTITDAKGVVLASSRPHYVVSVLPDEQKKNPQALSRLAAILKTTAAELQAILDKNKTTPFDPVAVARDVEMTVLTQIEEQKFDLPGVLITRDPKREYRDKKMLTHILGLARPMTAERLEEVKDRGYRGSDSIGVAGLEASYEDDLRGREGGQMIEVNAKGRMLHILGEEKPQSGNTLQLTLDMELQQLAYTGLQDQLAKGHAGAVVAMDPNDGAVLVCASTPSYDLNLYGKDYNQLRDDPQFPLINRAVNAAHPCGSPFKLVTAVAGLESGTTSPYQTYVCTGSIRRGRVWKCDVHSGHGYLDFETAIGKSCNPFFWLVAERAGAENLAKWAKRLGLGERTEIDLPGSVDTAGLIPTEAWKQKRHLGSWYLGDTLNMAIGQGFVQATVLQLAVMTSAFANGGNVMQPQLVREVTDTSSGKPVITHRLEPHVRHPVGWKPETRDAVVRGMVRAMQRGGTAAGVALPGVSMAGKTGTAQAGGSKKDHAVFVCFAPLDKPRIAIAVFVENGGWGAETAAPIARRVLERFFQKEIAAAHSALTPSRRSYRSRRWR